MVGVIIEVELVVVVVMDVEVMVVVVAVLLVLMLVFMVVVVIMVGWSGVGWYNGAQLLVQLADYSVGHTIIYIEI